MSPNSCTPFQTQMQRIFYLTETRTQAELAAYFGVGLAAVEEAVQSDKIPAEWLVAAHSVVCQAGFAGVGAYRAGTMLFGGEVGAV